MTEKRNVLIIGHRGANNIAPENTLKSFAKAIELNADYVEFDVHITKDKEIVIMHDANTFATTGHKGLIKSMTLTELKKLDCGEGEKIPTLNELIELTKNKIGLQIEIKAKSMAELLVKILQEEDLMDSSIISSFLHEELIKIQKIAPLLKLATLEPIITKWSQNWEYISSIITKAGKNHYYAIHPRFQLVNQEFIDFAHKNNLKVNLWTVNTKASMKKFVEMGVDGIITDDISKAKDVLNR